MNPAEGEGLRRSYVADQFGFAGDAGAAAAKQIGLVEKKITRRRAVLNRKGCKGISFLVEPEHLIEVDCAENVDVMYEKRLVGITKKGCSLLESAPSIE